MNKSLLVRAAPAIFLLLWSGGFTVAKIGISDADPITLLALRYFCVIVLLLPFLLVIRPPFPTRPQEWLHLMLVGFLIQVVYFGTAWIAFSLGGSAATVALITSMQPILVALIVPSISNETVSNKRWLGLLLGLLGAIMVIVGNSGLQPFNLTVILFSIASLLAISIATVWEKIFGTEHHPLTSNTIQYATGFLCTLPLAWMFEPMQIKVTVPFILALTYLVVCNSILAISLLLMMIRRGEVTRVSALFFLVPPVAAVIAWLVLGEKMSVAAWGGLGLTAIGVWLVTNKTTTADASK